MQVIDLIYTKYNGGSLPEHIRINRQDYMLVCGSREYRTLETEEPMTIDFTDNVLNMEVEIIRDKSSKIDKLEGSVLELKMPYGINEETMWTEIIKQHNKINEIIDYIKKED